MKNGRTVVAQDIASRMKKYLLLGKYEDWFAQNEVKYVEVIVPNCDGSKVIDTNELGDIFNDLNILQPAISPTDYVAATRAALDIEKQLDDEEKAEMSRDNIRCYFFHPPERKEQLHVVLTALPTTDECAAWSLGSHETIVFRKQGRLMARTEEVICEESVFATAPTPVPQGKDLLYGWTGRTYLRDDTLCAKIENDLSLYIDNDLLKHVFNTTHEGFSVKVATDNTRRTRIDHGLDTLEKVMMFENGSLGEDLEVPSFISQYKLNMSSLFLDRVPYVKTSTPRLLLQDETSWPSTYQGGNSTQRRAILAALTASEGIACIQGPPATGKTTTISHLLCSAIEMLDPRGGLIVCGAEMNEAVYVMATRFREIYSSIHGDNAAIAKIVVVDTKVKQQYARLSGETPREEIKPLLLRSHMQIIARSDLAKYKDWLIGDRTLKLRGHITDNKTFKAYTVLGRRLISIIKSRHPICFSTLGTMHCRDEFFSEIKGEPSFDCSLFVCDEASQVTSAGYAQSVITLNPTAVILCGDHKQLSPRLKSMDLLPILRKSIFERYITKGATSVVLDEEYRTREEIYCGTNIHYDNLVKVATEVRDKDSFFYTQFMENIGRVSFRQLVVCADGIRLEQVVHLSHNVHFINVMNGERKMLGDMQTSINKMEAEVVRGIVGCLLVCGMPHSSVLALTGYRGQNDLLKQDLARWGVRTRTIEGFQGGEADFVIFSAVRTPLSGIGSISRPSRQIVASSRAKDAFFLVGSLQMFQQARKRHPGWMETIDALRNFSVVSEERFQVDVEGGILEWCVDGEPVRLDDILGDFLETFDDPILRVGGDVETEDEDDGGVAVGPAVESDW